LEPRRAFQRIQGRPVLSRIRDKNIWLVYASIFLVGIAYGLSIALLALFLDAHGFDKTAMGGLAAVFASGICAISLPIGWILRKVSAKRTLVGALLGYSVCVTIFPYLGSFLGLAIARFFDGAFSVGVWVSCETVLLARADKENKAFVTSLYAMSLAIGYVIGPILSKSIVAVFPMHTAFVCAGALALLAALVASRLDGGIGAHEDPAPAGAPADDAPADAAPAPRALAWRTKTSLFATFAYGYFQSSAVLFLPLYLMKDRGVAEKDTILITAFFALGMLLFSNYAGKLGDRYGHLLVMRNLSAAGFFMVASFVLQTKFSLMCLTVFGVGATLASISPVSLALQGAITEKHEIARANAVYNVFYAAGMLVGPPLSGLVFDHVSGRAMILHFSLLWLAFAIFGTVFAKDDPAARRAAARPAT
jgi:MFS family permease